MALRVITPTHIWVNVYYAIHSNGLLNCTASKRGPSSNACASRRAQCRTRTVGAQYAHKTRYAAEKTGAVVKMDGNERTLVDMRIGARKVITRNIAHLRAFTVVDFHVLPRYHAPCTGARARVIAQNIAYHFTREGSSLFFLGQKRAVLGVVDLFVVPLPFYLVVFTCNIWLGVGRHWWLNYPGLLLHAK